MVLLPILHGFGSAMTEETLRQLIAGGETATVEFKIKAPRPAELAERMCGMANTRSGGVIIFGVEDGTQAVVGVAQLSETIDTALRAARMIRPPLTITDTTIRTWALDKRSLVTVEIPPTDGRLYQYAGAFLIRRGTHTVPMAVEEVQAFLYASGTARWELELCSRATIEDLDGGALERYLASRTEESRKRRRHSTPEELLLGLEAAVRDPQTGAMQPTNAGMLMFGYDPQLLLPQSEVVCIKYDDPLGVRKYIDRKNFVGTLPELIDQAGNFLKQYIRVGATIRGFYREDEPEYPYEALREAVVNAVVHRDYSRLGETVRVFMFPDRVEVRSPGGLLPGITLNALVEMRVTSMPRNRVLAGFLREIPGYMERVGSGIRFMVSEMREMSLPEPEFTEHFDFVVTFRNGAVSTEQAVVLNERQQLGLRLIRERGSISNGEYAAATNTSERTALRELREMVERGVIVTRGRTRGLRYYLP